MPSDVLDLGAIWTVRKVEQKLPGTVLARRAKWMLQSGASAAAIRAEINGYARKLAELSGQDEPEGAA
jgi:hypothetical protein